MKFSVTSLAIGIGIGVAVAAVVALLTPRSAGVDSINNSTDFNEVIVESNRTHFFMSGLVTELTKEIMILDQTFGRPDFNDNPQVRVRLDGGAAFVSCKPSEPANSCKDSVLNKLGKEPIYVCALTRIYNGQLYAGKIWADAGCGPISIEGQPIP